MPNTKTAKKQVRVTAHKTLRNQPVLSQLKTKISKAEKLIAEGDKEKAVEAVGSAVSSLDKASVKGILKANTASRRKSRLIKKLNKVGSETAAD